MSSVTSRLNHPIGQCGDSDMRQKPAAYREAGLGKLSQRDDGTAQVGEDQPLLGARGKEVAKSKAREDEENQAAEVVDPLAGMAEVDKWGIKGLRTLMNNYPDYHAMVVGMDPGSLGLEMSSTEYENVSPVVNNDADETSLFSNNVFSLFDDAPPKPTLNAGKYRLPDCYNVTNVQPIETKIQSFNEETLFWIFYSCPADVKQQLAAVEL